MTRGKDYSLLDHAEVQARLHLPADQHLSSAKSGIDRVLSDCPDQRLDESGLLVRIIVATHPAPVNPALSLFSFLEWEHPGLSLRAIEKFVS